MATKRPVKKKPFMTSDELRKLIDKAGFPSISEYQRFSQISPKTVFRYLSDGSKIPAPAADLLRLIAAGKVTRKQIEDLR